MKDKQYFDDELILEQSVYLVKNSKGKMTNGISLLIKACDVGTEMVLERKQIAELLNDLEQDLKAYSANVG